MQSPFIKAYWELVDASGLGDEEFERRMEEAAAEKARKRGCLYCSDGCMYCGKSFTA